MRKSNTTIILEGMHLVGQIEGTHDLYLAGNLKGNVDVAELVKVGKSGRFEGELKAKNIIIEGEVDGKITAKEQVEIHASGHLKGDIISPSILISHKAFFEGKVTMVREDKKLPEKLGKSMKRAKELLKPRERRRRTDSPVSSRKNLAAAVDGKSKDSSIRQAGIDCTPVVTVVHGAKHAAKSSRKNLAAAVDAKNIDSSRK